MKFIEHSRVGGYEEGTVIVKSKADKALEDFERTVRHVDQVRAELLVVQNNLESAMGKLITSEESLINALHEHYEGDVPQALSTSFGTLLIEDRRIEVIKTASYSDLYRIEKKEAA
ncbi:MAG: hypothetical protein KKH74_01865 [Gammaproteobacteria bacterium]|nr:hypothetical protein [Gammaproteobacteria bacterium]MBU1731010.1 hypothetical protein [Gammaproteobacteria bacterium]MBU1893670.1 hypothetical protein [Gammaproteobacteria bacterium]